MKLCGGVVVAFALFFLLLPFGVKYYLADWLEKNGADRATIEKLRFNPFVGRVTLGGVDVQLGGKSILQNARMMLDLGIPSLFNHDIRVEKAEYQGLSIDLEQYEDGRWRYGSYTTEVEHPEKDEELKQDAAVAWNFLADQVVLKDCSVHLRTPELDMTLVINDAELQRLTTREEQPAGSFTFKGQLNGGPVVLQLDTVQLVPELRLGGNISIEKFQLAQLSRILIDVMPTFAGEVGLNGQLFFSQGPVNGMLTEYNGNIGVTGPDIGNIDFTTKAENLSWKGKMHYAEPVNSPGVIETDGQLAARNFDLQIPASRVSMKESGIDLNGKTSLIIAKNMLVENEGSLHLEGVELLFPPYDIAEDSCSWKGKVRYDSDHNQEGLFVRADGFVDLGEFQVGGEGEAAPFAMGGKMASWLGTVEVSQMDAGKKSALALNGTLFGGELRITLAEPELRFGHEKLELNTKAIISLGEDTDIRGSNSLTLAKFSLFEGKNTKPIVSFDRLELAELEGKGGKTISIKDILTVGLKSSISGKFPLDIDIPEIKLLDFSTEDMATFKLAELRVARPLITAVRSGEELARLDDLAVTHISFDDGGKLGAENARIQNFAFLGSQNKSVTKAAVSFAGASLNDITWSNAGGFQGNILQFEDLVATVLRDKDGNINISQQLAEMQQAESIEDTPAEDVVPDRSTTTTAAEEKPKGALFKLQKTVVAGKSAVFFKDYTLAVPYVTDLAISRLEVTRLDSSQPEQKTEITLQGELENRAPLAVTGEIYPFKEKPGINMKVDLKNYPLSNLSAYTVQSAGTALASGQLQLKSSLVLGDDKLNMKNAVLLKKLETKTIAPKLAAELNNQLPIPLDAALSILRDSERNISLDIPLSGPVSELNIGVSDVMITALSKAIVPAASGYLMYALGPYGALAYVGMKVGEKMLQVELPPVVFTQQEISLTEEHVNYLQRIGKILQDRPETDIQICPTVASWEFLTEQEHAAIKGDIVKVDEKQQAKLLQIGQERAAAVQSLLENDYDIARSRLLICDTKIETKKSAIPAVLLQL